MSLTVKQFIDQLAQSGVLTESDLDALQDTLSDPPETVEQLASELIRRKKLTPFQVERVCKGKASGLLLGNYLILDTIGAGGMGRVYLAEHRRMERRVALKVLPPALVEDKHAVDRFQREVKAAAKLSHSNIVTAHDADQSGEVHFFVMEHVEGSDLAKLVNLKGPLSVDQAVECIRQVAAGLDYAHRKSVIHRDIKPGNLLINTEGVVKILDMGLARYQTSVEEEEGLTATGMGMGTPDFMAPEQGQNAKNADERSDIYSLGCTLYYLLTGRKPFGGESLVEKVLAHQNEPVPSLSEACAEATPELDAVFQRMVAKEPGARYQTAAELLADLSALSGRDVAEGSGVSSLAAPLRSLVAGGTATSATVTYQRQDQIVDRDTLVSSIHDDTAEKQKQAQPAGRQQARASRNGWLVAVVGLVAVAALLGALVIKLQTPAGTVVLEIDQPELMGAVVTIDGETKITIKTGKGKEPIEIRPDDKRHLLEVKIAGYKTFSKEFSFETGNKQTIKVRLEPLEAEPDQPASQKNYALRFDGESSYVETPVKYDGSHALTVEAWVTPYSCQPPFYKTLVGNAQGFGLLLSLVHDRWSFAAYFDGNEEAVGPLTQSAPFTRSPTHVCAVIDLKRILLFINGKKQMETAVDSEGGHKASPFPLLIGADTFTGHEAQSDTFLHGLIDEVRISKVARHTEDFTPQQRFVSDEHTIALYHFDEGSGTVLRDSSGHGHDGEIHGAEWVEVDDQLNVIQPSDPHQKNYALQFDGDQQYVRFLDRPHTLDGPVTAEAWCVVTDSKESGSGRIVCVSNLNLDILAGRWGMDFYDYKRGAVPHELGNVRCELGKLTHIAGIYDGRQYRLYVDGVEVVTVDSETEPDSKRRPNLFCIGGFFDGGSRSLTAGFLGIIDEVRISKIARYKENFTPAKRFEPDEHTLALYHFDAGSGTVLRDSSGNGHHGKIVDANWVKVDDELKVLEYIWPTDQPAPAIAPFTAEQAKKHQEGWAEHLGGEVETTNSIGMKFRVIPPGEFLMGSSEEEIGRLEAIWRDKKLHAPERLVQEGPLHRVTISRPFLLSATEVTVSEFRRFVEATSYKTDAEKEGEGSSIYRNGKHTYDPASTWQDPSVFEQTDQHPVVAVSWNDAVQFCRWLSERDGVEYRLPTEAEWEYVCRAGTNGAPTRRELEQIAHDIGSGTHPVRDRTPNALGVFGLWGNASEWCHDWYGQYGGHHQIDPTGPTEGTERIYRGGGIHLRSPEFLRSACRPRIRPSHRWAGSSFRIVRTFEKLKPEAKLNNNDE